MSFLVYLTLPPLCLALLISYPTFLKILITKNDFHFFSAGIIAYTLLHLIYRKSTTLSKIYIFFHELSHAIVGFLKGNRIRKIKISSKSGYVSFSKRPDKLTTILPYIFPILNIIIALAYFIFTIISGSSHYRLFLFLQASALMFHILNTFEISTTPQSDFRRFGGRLLSLTIIFASNALIIPLITLSLFPDPAVLKSFTLNTVANYTKIISALLKVAIKLCLFIKLCS